MKYNEKVERFAPKLGRKNLANGLSCPPFVYMDDSDDGMWVHYAKYCKNIAKQKYKRCLAMAMWCTSRVVVWTTDGNERKSNWYWKWKERWKNLAEKFKEKK
ncbi:hypothetical protein [Fibrobacter succinogenes]|uniref:hypothetical protein n=1 Tax=Fibrobacter succinogenes TaxID=833 RepID=UPI00156442CD|nr:hypothetical protein [Fibrobacter succinogenes]